jgi:hypothetical protein
VALRIKLGLAGETMHGSEQEAMQHLGAEVEHVLDEVRGAASGSPPALRQDGVATALRSLARSAVIPVRVTDRFGQSSGAGEARSPAGR